MRPEKRAAFKVAPHNDSRYSVDISTVSLVASTPNPPIPYGQQTS